MSLAACPVVVALSSHFPKPVAYLIRQYAGGQVDRAQLLAFYEAHAPERVLDVASMRGARDLYLWFKHHIASRSGGCDMLDWYVKQGRQCALRRRERLRLLGY